MKNKAWILLLWTIFTLTFFSSIRVMALYYYHLQQTQATHTPIMVLIDKAGSFNLSSYITGGLHFSVIIVVLMILLDK